MIALAEPTILELNILSNPQTAEKVLGGMARFEASIELAVPSLTLIKEERHGMIRILDSSVHKGSLKKDFPSD